MKQHRLLRSAQEMLHFGGLLLCLFRSRRVGLLRLTPASTKVRLECLGGQCGLCCSVMGGEVVVSSKEACAFSPSSLVIQGSHIKLSGQRGMCSQLRDKSCHCYEIRPRGCREYPWYNIDGALFFDRGCPGIKFDLDGRPDPKDITPIDSYFKTSNAIRQIMKAVMKRW